MKSIIAVDESGRDGSNLVMGGAFILGSTTLTDSESDVLLNRYLGRPPQSAREWKWRSAAKRPVQVLDFLKAIPVENVVSIAIHQRFFGWCKAVDSLLYEYPVIVLDMPGNDGRQMAMVSLAQNSWEGVRGHLDPFLAAWVEAVRHPSNPTVACLRTEASSLLHSTTLPVAKQTIELMSEVLDRLEPPELRQVMLDQGHIDPHVPAVGSLIEAWRDRLDHPDATELTILHDVINSGDTIDRWTPLFDRLGVTVTRGNSHDHPALQVADLVAGATRAAFQDPTSATAGRTTIDTARLVERWLPPDLVIWPWKDPRSSLRSDGVTGMRTDFDR